MPTVNVFPWFVYPPAVDLANTLAPGAPDLLADRAGVASFVRVERGRVPGVDVVAERPEDVIHVRDVVRHLFAARTRGEVPHAAHVALVNAWSASAPTYTVLTTDGVEHVDGGESGWASWRGAVARSAIELVGETDSGLRICDAPGCGMFYVRSHRRQEWCSPACGNRARVARHAARIRAVAT